MKMRSHIDHKDRRGTFFDSNTRIHTLYSFLENRHLARAQQCRH